MKAERSLFFAILCLILMGIDLYLYFMASTTTVILSAGVALFFSFLGAVVNSAAFAICNSKDKENE